MLYATNRFPGDGGTTTYEFNFTGGYLQREHVKAYIEDAAGERTAVPVNPDNWINSYTLGGLPTTPVGSTFVIYRETPRLPLVDFTTNSRLTEGNLDITARQGVFVAAEALDQDGAGGGGGPGTGGDVFGPASASPTAIAEFEDSSGKRLRSTNYSVNQIVDSIATKAPSSHTHANATTSTAGFMSALDKTKLDSMSGGGGTGGGGDVFGPPSSVYTGIAEFADTSGKLLRTTNFSVAQLNLAIDAKAASTHGHAPASAVQPGFMSSADKIKLDSLTPGGGGTAPAKLRIVVLGDSMSAQQNALGQAWPGLLEDSIRANGVDVEVHNLSINGMSFGNVNSEVSFNGTATMQARAISLNPDIVLVALGANDAVTGSRTTATQAATVTAMTNAATSLFSALRSALPSAVILYASQTTWDRTHKPNPNSTGLLSREAPGLYQQRTTSGLAAGLVSEQMMSLSLTANENSRFAGFYLADNAVRALSTHNGTLDLDLWKVNRLGCFGSDNTHPNVMGHRLLNAAVYTGLQANTAAMSKMVSLGSQLIPYWNSLTQIFNDYLVDSGGQWIARNSLPVKEMHISRHTVSAGELRPITWFYPSGGQVTTSATTLVKDAVYTVLGTGLTPRVQVSVSNDGVTFIPAEAYTDAFGNTSLSYSFASLSGASPVNFNFYLKAGEELFGPFPLSVAARGASASGDVTGPAGATTGALASFSDTSGKLLTNTGRTIGQIDASIAARQAALVSGSNIKTVGGASILGAGNIDLPAAFAPSIGGPDAITTAISGVDTLLKTVYAPKTGINIISWSVGGTFTAAASMLTRITVAGAAVGQGSSISGAASSYGTSSGCAIVSGVTAGAAINVYGSVTAGSFTTSATNNASRITCLAL